MYNSLPSSDHDFDPAVEKAFLKAEALQMHDGRAVSPSELKLLRGDSYNSLRSSDFQTSPTKFSGFLPNIDAVSCCSDSVDVKVQIFDGAGMACSLKRQGEQDVREHSTSLPDLNQIILSEQATDQKLTNISSSSNTPWTCSSCVVDNPCSECHRLKQCERTVHPLDRRKSDPDSMRKVIQRHQLKPIELTLSVNPNDNRLSKVLESIPLVYIPQTKQLVSSRDRTNQSAPSSDNLSNQNPAVNDVDEALTNQDRPPLTANRIAPNSPRALDKRCDKSDSESSTLTIGHEDEKIVMGEEIADDAYIDATRSPGNEHVPDDWDLDTVDQLESPRNSIQWPPSLQQTMPSQNRTDASSFSSMSSISTDYSLSTIGDEFLDGMKSIPLDSDEAGFMDVNLHARNTFDKSSTLSSQDSGIEDKSCSQGAKPKRRGISFLAR